MEYWKSFMDSTGYIHSIDMIYVEYYLYSSDFELVFDLLREIHEQYTILKYTEYLGRMPCSKYDFYRDSIAIGGAFVSVAKYASWDRINKSMDIFPMLELRVNPNKICNAEWWKTFFPRLMELCAYGMLRKYDYAVDIPTLPCNVDNFYTRKEKGLYKGTRYYGQSGKHGYTKIYDKQRERIKCREPDTGALTRVEHTLCTNSAVSLENVSVRQTSVSLDLSGLRDTEVAIVEMYQRLQSYGDSYVPVLGRKMMDKLRPYLQGTFVPLDYGDYLEKLLDEVSIYFRCDINNKIDDFLKPLDENEIPFI